MDGDPGEAVAFYRERALALAAGWTLVFEGCSRAEQATGAAFTKSFGATRRG